MPSCESQIPLGNGKIPPAKMPLSCEGKLPPRCEGTLCKGVGLQQIPIGNGKIISAKVALSCEGKLPPRCKGALLPLSYEGIEGSEGIGRLGKLTLTGTLSRLKLPFDEEQVGQVDSEAAEREDEGGDKWEASEASDGGR
jgi:hypothetical protein